MNPKVSIIILNWNGWKDTIECLESLYQITYPNYDVIVVDNGSKDESIEKIKEYAEGKIKVKSKFFEYSRENKPIKIVEYTREEAEAGGGKEKEIGNLPSNRKLIIVKNEKNYGFAEGNNIGMRYALKALNPDYILLLNNDTVVDKEFLGELVKVGESDSNKGIVGSKIYDYYTPNLIQCAGGDINWVLGKIKEFTWIEDNNPYSKTCERDFVWATSALIKKEVLERVGLLDAYFFFGIEEYDHCTSAKKAGFKIIYLSTSKIWHKKGASSKKLEEYPEIKRMISKQRGFLLYKHYHRLFMKHLPPIIYIFPYLFFMLRPLLKLSLSFIKYLLTGNLKRIKEGFQKLR